ncbi:hypothetical protein LptCag_0550 [Leptospirillum ferriphilum]|uniref:Uncharacterized protein n=1 Tax=Leptospirillum ferriphilum TaxID=178606 RepID=A0A094X5V3_9BACT|nr:hypothetical protein LptCag_0550 [Leptospirillum ferriphilum]
MEKIWAGRSLSLPRWLLKKRISSERGFENVLYADFLREFCGTLF